MIFRGLSIPLPSSILSLSSVIVHCLLFMSFPQNHQFPSTLKICFNYFPFISLQSQLISITLITSSISNSKLKPSKSPLIPTIPFFLTIPQFLYQNSVKSSTKISHISLFNSILTSILEASYHSTNTETCYSACKSFTVPFCR